MSKIVVVQASRHGLGVSNLVANLAVLLASRGSRIGVLDTDPDSSGPHSLFGLDETLSDPAINQYLRGDYPNQNSLESLLRVGHGSLTLLSGGVYLLPSGLRVSEIARSIRQGGETGRIGSSIYELMLRLNLDVLLVDTQPSLQEETLLMMTVADTLLLLLGLDPPDFQKTAVAVDIAHQLAVPQLHLIPSQVLPKYRLDHVKQELESTYQVPVAGVLPFAEEMLLLAGSGVFCLHYPDHPLTQQTHRIADRILGSDSPPRIPTDAGYPPNPDQVISLSMAATLLLPTNLRQLIHWLLRQHQAIPLSEISTYLQQDPTTTAALLADLQAQGFLETPGSESYQPRLPQPLTHPFQPL